MSGTIAQLGIEVDSGDAVKAATDLDKLVDAGKDAEEAAKKTGSAWEQALASMAGDTKQIVKELQLLNAKQDATAQLMATVGRSLAEVTQGLKTTTTATTELTTAEVKLGESTEDAKSRLLAMAKASLESSEYYQRLTTSMETNSAAMDASGSSASSLAALARRLKADSDALVGSTDKEADAAKRAAAATGVQAEGLQALLGKINPAIAALDKLDQQQAQLQKYKAAGLIDADTFREYSARIDASRQKLGDFDEGLKKTGASSKQTETALRQLPSQFTDIFTSLAGGQNPLMVLIQQGGQIKDSFGGIGPTMDALKEKFRSLFTGGAGAAALGESLAGIASGAKDTADNAGEASESLSDLAESSNTAAEAAENAQKAVGAITPAMSGVTIGAGAVALAILAAAAALGTLIYGYSQGSKEADEYNKSLILTGNYAGTSAAQLANLAQQVSATNGTTGEAAASLAKLAASGVIAGGSFKDIADAAAAMEDATGTSVDATIAEFVKIAKDPVAAAKELNDQYHFLTASVYSQIVALKEQGDTIGAAKLLTDTYADTVKTRSTEITENLGFIERAWKGVKDEASKSLDAIKNIGRDQAESARVTELNQKIAYLQSTIGTGYEDGDAKQRLTALKDELSLIQDKQAAEKQEAQITSDNARTQKEGIEAEQRLKQISDSTLSNAEKRNKLIKAYLRDVEVLKRANPDDPKVQADYVAKTLQNIKDRNKDPKGPSAGAVDLTGYNAAQNALKEIQAEYANTQKQLDAAQKAGLISQQEYLLKREALIGNERDEVTSAYEAEIAALEAAKAKASTTAEQRIQIDQKIEDARADMVRAQKAADSELDVLAKNEQGRLRKQEQAVQTYTNALQQQVDTLREQGQRAAAGLGQGDRQRGLTDQQNAIDDRFNSQKLDLANQYGDGSRGMSLDEYTQKLAALKATQKDLHDTVQANYDEMTAAQGDWSAGASSAWQNYLESARDVAGQTKSLFTNAFSSMEDAIVNFAMTGKLSFADFTKSILADMARIATRQASSALLSSLVGAATSYFTGGGATASATAGGAEAGAQSFGSQFDASSASVSFGGGRAVGGGVEPNTFYEVNENGPELFNQGGRSYLMTGASGGSVTPLTSGGGPALAAMSGTGGGNTYNFPVSVSVQTAGGAESPATSQQASADLGKGVQQVAQSVVDRAIAKELQPGGAIWQKINRR
ncbi:phage tail tape measure protein [Pseudomonas sp. GM80]|uniref:phage tail tape measure protein n=1 Tax=Pseudomonas sp. GM80 TaxID=1144339 RepID=UPI00026F4DEB|nr:phage tail tape measure protein [Pseudomonas sp. GM80]EJN36302.1 phage tail tape measure protein, lambda family [Pseudomonas sp. GM80]